MKRLVLATGALGALLVLADLLAQSFLQGLQLLQRHAQVELEQLILTA